MSKVGPKWQCPGCRQSGTSQSKYVVHRKRCWPYRQWYLLLQEHARVAAERVTAGRPVPWSSMRASFGV